MRNLVLFFASLGYFLRLMACSLEFEMESVLSIRYVSQYLITFILLASE